MKKQGCAITSCAMIFKVSPDNHLSEMKADGGPIYNMITANRFNSIVTISKINGLSFVLLTTIIKN